MSHSDQRLGTLLIPVTATLLGVVFLAEALTVQQVVGAIVIATGLRAD